MGKDLSEIDDIYRTSYEEITEEFSNKVRDGKDRNRARIEYRKKFHKILNKRNKEYLDYVKKHKEEILGMPEKKKGKIFKKEVYKAYHINFEETRAEKLKKFFKRTFFHFVLFLKKIKYNFVPSWVKFFVFRVMLFFRSIWIDISLFFRGIKLNIFRVFNRYFERVREKILFVFSRIKNFFGKISDWNKARLEKKKKEREEKMLKKEEEKREREKEKDSKE